MGTELSVSAGLTQRIARLRELRLLLIIVAFATVMYIYDHRFLKPAYIETTLRFCATYAIMACGMTVLLVSGGFDLSVGSVFALSAMVSALLMKQATPLLPWPVAAAAGLATGAAVGVFNGLAVARLGINPFITTLGTMMLARGLTFVISGGNNLAGLPAGFCWLGAGKILGVPMLVIISLVLVVVFDLLLRKSRFFRQNYYIGGNEQAAWLSGISVNRIKILNYGLSGALAALAGLLFSARTGSANVTFGEGDELKVITAVIIGGASLAGGKGTVFGAFLGCLLLAMIQPTMSLTGIHAGWEKVIVGGILLFAVLLDSIGRK